MNKVSKLAATVAASAVAGIATMIVLTASGGTVTADGCDDMHWLVCGTVEDVTDTVTDTVEDVTGPLPGVLPDDMHW